MHGVYWLVGENSPAMKAILAAEEQYKLFSQAVEALRIKHGAVGAFTYGRRGFAGLKFAGEVPPGWRKRKDGTCVPDSRTKVGRQVKKDVDSMPKGYDSWAFSDSLGSEYAAWKGSHVYWSTFGKLGDKYVLRVPSGCKVTPEGCTELRMSEYWAIREAAGIPSRTDEEEGD